jgi:predicted DNA-binding transcriptional regulator YafY
MSETTSSRLLSLLSLLQGRRDWPGDELAERLEVSGRTIRRDVERLRRLGYPVESLTGPAGGYRLAAGTAMPPLLLDDDEAIAIAVGLRTAARASVTGIEETSLRALVKLEQVLPSHLRRRVRALGDATAIGTAPGGPTVDPQALTVIAAACRDHECVRFHYTGRDGAESRREVEPHSLVNLGRRWYLVAWDRGRGDWRTFRLDRLARPASTGVRCAGRTLPGDKDAAAYVSANLRTAPQAHEAVVTLRCSGAEMRARPYLWGTVEDIDDSSCTFRRGDDNLVWLATRIALLGVVFVVHEPPELVEALGAVAARISRAVAGAQASSRAV